MAGDTKRPENSAMEKHNIKRWPKTVIDISIGRWKTQLIRINRANKDHTMYVTKNGGYSIVRELATHSYNAFLRSLTSKGHLNPHIRACSGVLLTLVLWVHKALDVAVVGAYPFLTLRSPVNSP